MNLEQIAEICHEANRTFCAQNGDASQQPWTEAPDWQRNSCLDGVKFAHEHPECTPEQSHENWVKLKESEGWVYGPIKDADLKQHPCLVPYAGLTEEMQIKDHLFQGIVKSLLRFC